MKKPIITLILLLAFSVSFKAYCLPVLNSLPSAAATIYLDFDGQDVNSAVWNGGVPFTAAAAGLTDAQITEIFNRVAEDYRPFNINITTDSTVYLTAPVTQRTRVIVTPTSDWYQGVGGISYVGSFTWGDDTPCFVFCDRLSFLPKLVGEACSHESGHTLGLYHQAKYDSTCTLIETYNSGDGTGETSWAPIMGNSYYKNMSGWNNGSTPYGCTIDQDNLSIITTQNGFTYRVDDAPNDINSSPNVIDPNSFTASGIISTTTDKDAYKFTLSHNSNLHMDIRPYSVGPNDDGADLDVKVQLYNSSKQLIRTYDPLATMSVSLDTVLNTGDYYMLIDGTGNANVSDYGSLGAYTVTGITGLLPIRDVVLTGSINNDKHDLSWNIISDDAIKSIVIEASTDGTNFSTISSTDGNATSYNYTPYKNANIYYRLKVTSVVNQTIYSNVISLQNVGVTAKSFGVSNFVKNEIAINAPSSYEYQLMDVNGRLLNKGNGAQGYNTINVSSQPKGIYLLQIISYNQRQTERIIRQ